MSAIHVAIVASMLLSLNSSMMSESRVFDCIVQKYMKKSMVADDLDPYIQPVFASKSGRLAVSVRCWSVVCFFLFFCLFVCLVGWLFVCLVGCLFVCLLVGWFVCLFVCLLLCFALRCVALICFASLIVCLFWLAALACACCLRSRSSCPYQTPIPQN